MTELKKCRACGVDVPTNAPFGHCPQCLLELGFGAMPKDAEESAADSAVGTPNPALGTVRYFGDYELLEQIGHGGMGIVYKARQRSLNRIVALKMISAGEFASPSAVQRFQIEAEAAAKLDHPNIVPIYEIGVHRGQHYFSMKFVEGRSLADEIRDGKFRIVPAERSSSKFATRQQQASIARLIATVARSVHYAHQHGILHRDLKPGNILLDGAGQQHLTDFGLAKILEHEVGVSGSNEVLGTPSYMSPEQAAGKPATRASDIYSLGVILYELLTGRPPFHAETPMETMRRVTQDEPTHPTTLNRQADPELATICLKCLEKDPLRRYSSPETLAEDLERWLRHEPIHARPASVSFRLHRWTHRNPAVALLIVALFLGLTVTAVLLKTVHEKDRDKGEAMGLIREHLEQELNDLWAHPEKSDFVLITSEKRAVLRPDERGTPGQAAARFRFGIYSQDQIPTTMLPWFSPVLVYLEKSMSEKLHQPVRIDFLIFRSYEVAMDELLTNGVDFARFGAASYVIAKGSNAAVSIVAAQKHEHFRGVIFTQATNQAVQTINDLRGKTLAFGHTNSTTGSQLAKFYLAGLGFHARDFSNHATNYLRNHADVTNAVAQGKFDAAASKESYATNASFRILGAYPNIGMVWVGKPNLSSSNRQALTECLLSVKPALVKKLEDAVIGFESRSDADYEELRKKMKTAEEFEQR